MASPSRNGAFGWRRLLLAAALAGASCGYRFTPEGDGLPGGVRSLYVPVFRNATSEPGIEAAFTEALRVELARRGREGGAASDATASGTVTEVLDGAAIYSNAGPPLSFRIRAAATVRLMRGNETLREVRVAGDEDYLPSAPGAKAVLADEASRRIALRRLSQRLMRDAVEQLLGP